MKENLPYFSHDNNSRNHPKMKALIAEYGYEGYGRFWILNEKIAEASGVQIDISKKIYKLDLARELGFDGNGLDKFISFLADPEIDLINLKDGIITTDRINDLYSKAAEKRENQRSKKQPKNENEEIADENGKIASENEEIVDDFDTDKNRIDKNRQEKKVANGSGEPPPILSDSQKQAVELSGLLLILHRKEFPDFLSGKKDTETISRWAQDIEKLIRLDKKEPEKIRQVILWVKTPGNFWFPNIESGKKLREKYENLWSQMQTRENNIHVKLPERNSFVPDADETEKMLRGYEQDRRNADSSLSLSGELRKVARNKL